MKKSIHFILFLLILSFTLPGANFAANINCTPETIISEAEAGNPEMQYVLGLKYLEFQEYDKAFEMFYKSGTQHFPPSYAEMGRMYYDGTANDKNLVTSFAGHDDNNLIKAFKCYEIAALSLFVEFFDDDPFWIYIYQKEIIEAQLWVSSHYGFVPTYERDLVKSYLWLKIVETYEASKILPEYRANYEKKKQNIIKFLAETITDEEKALAEEEFRQYLTDPDKWRAGYKIYSGQYFPENEKNAIKSETADFDAKNTEEILRKAKDGDAAMQFVAGKLYMIGDGVDRDDDKALEMLLKSAEQGFAPSLGSLAVFYGGGSVHEDPVKGLQYSERAALAPMPALNNLTPYWRNAYIENVLICPYMIALFYTVDSEIEQDFVKTYVWHKIARLNDFKPENELLQGVFEMLDGMIDFTIILMPKSEKAAGEQEFQKYLDNPEKWRAAYKIYGEK